MAAEWIGRDPPSEFIAEMCQQFQRSWSDEERSARQGKMIEDGASWTVPQFLPHHCESGQWAKGRERKVVIWRCVNGR
jgi:hypothetical protein